MKKEYVKVRNHGAEKKNIKSVPYQSNRLFSFCSNYSNTHDGWVLHIFLGQVLIISIRKKEAYKWLNKLMIEVHRNWIFCKKYVKF